MQVKHFIPLLRPIDNTFAGVSEESQVEYMKAFEWIASKADVTIGESYSKKAMDALNSPTGKDIDCKSKAIGFITLGITEKED